MNNIPPVHTIYEIEAERAYARQSEIEKAAVWCKKNYPHKFQFLNEMYMLLTVEERQYIKLGFHDSVRSKTVKFQPVLSLLTPSQALRLLESFKRATINDPKIWKVKNIDEIEKLESNINRDKIVASIKEQLLLRKQSHDGSL